MFENDDFDDLDALIKTTEIIVDELTHQPDTMEYKIDVQFNQVIDEADDEMYDVNALQ